MLTKCECGGTLYSIDDECECNCNEVYCIDCEAVYSKHGENY